MKTRKNFFLALVFALVSFTAFSQSTLPNNFRANTLKEFNQLSPHDKEGTFDEFYRAKAEDFLRVQAKSTLQFAVPINTSVCGNGDFESTLTTADWWGEYGSLFTSGPMNDLPDFANFSSGFLSGPITSGAARHTIVTAGADPNVPINTTRTGTGSSMRIGNQVNGHGSEMISKRFTVTSTDALINFWYATVLQDPSHSLEAQPSFWVRVIDYTAGGVELTGVTNLGNGTEKIYSDINDPFFQVSGLVAYRDWTCAQINLSQVIGHNVEINFISEDCGLGAHYGYTYIDDICGDCSGNPTGDFDINLKRTDSCGPGNICIDYNLPEAPNGATGVLSVSVDIFQNGVQVGTLPGVSLVSGNTYCWTVSQTFLDALNQTPGGFDFVITGNFFLGGLPVGTQQVGVAPTGITSGQNNDYLLNCGGCWLDGDQKPANYTTFSNSFSINSDQLWDGKYYVEDNVTIFVNNAILDLTNVDIIFGECAGIVFGEGATLRANNSVFRPCDMNRTWQGFTFRGTADGVVNESTFKNAQIALSFQSVRSINVRVVNNLFENCRIGLGVFKSDFYDGITGNTFNVDRNQIFYDVKCKRVTTSDIFNNDYKDDHWGIIAINANFFGNISQNDFVNAQEITGTGTSKFFYGIALSERSTATISDNNFTDLFRSIDVNGSSKTNIENNEIEVNTFNYTNSLFSEHQIRVSSSQAVNITSNDFLYAFKKEAEQITWDSHSAIYLEKIESGTVTNNSITGFESGIQLQGASNLLIKENNLSDIGYCGVYVNDGRRVDVMCNTINMEDDFRTTSLGIYYRTYSKENPDVRFSGNCIFESSTAILVEGSDIKSCYQLPVISNNFMYNYTEFGVDGRYVQGSIGVNGNVRDAGRNTFASNNTTTGSIDVRALNCNISTNGNYGIITTSGSVSVGGDQYYSTASCGAQTPSDVDRLGKNFNETCDPIFVKNVDLLKGSAKTLSLADDYATQLVNASNLESQIPHWFSALATNYTTNELDKLHHTLLNGNYEIDVDYVSYFYYFVKGEFVNAENQLDKVSSQTADWSTLQEVLLQLAKEDRTLLPNDYKYIAKLQSLTAEREVYYHANQLLQNAMGGHDFPFIKIPAVQNVVSESVKTLDKNKVVIYPNPTTSDLTVDYYFKSEGTATVRIISIVGKVVSNRLVNNQSGKLVFNLSELKGGVYFIEISDENGERETQRFIKM